MGIERHILKTESLPWKQFGKTLTTAATIALSTISNGGTWSRRNVLGIVNLQRLWDDWQPNDLRLAPIALACSATVNSQVRFRVDVWKGENNLDRICDVRGTIGGYLTSQIGTGTALAQPLSSCYFHSLSILNDYGNDIKLHDAEGDNGKASLSFDLMGAGYAVANLVSTTPSAENFGLIFEATGF